MFPGDYGLIDTSESWLVVLACTVDKIRSGLADPLRAHCLSQSVPTTQKVWWVGNASQLLWK